MLQQPEAWAAPASAADRRKRLERYLQLLAAEAAAVSVHVGLPSNMRDVFEAAAAAVDTHMATEASLPLHMLCSPAVEEQHRENHMEPSRQWRRQLIAHQCRR